MPLYPAISPYKVHAISVNKPHILHVEECGNPDGIPLLFLHGGPGSGFGALHRRYFDPQKYRIVLFDQRGAGKSTPYGCLEHNTTQHLLNDIETIRETLNVKQWVLFAGSWGVALGLLYAETYPKHVSAMILRGAFLASKRDMEWFFDDGVSRVFPELWQRFSQTLTPSHNDEHLLETYANYLLSNDVDKQLKATKAWIEWTDSIVTWMLPETVTTTIDNPEKAIKRARLEVHYAINKYFIETDKIINTISKIPNIPVKIIHGQRDITCPLESSWRIHQALPQSELTVVREAGHLASEPVMIEALVEACDSLIID